VTTRREFAVSNIAWDPTEDDAVAKVLRAAGVSGVEIAPTKRWESPIEATKKEILEYRHRWERRGLRIVALQALLYGRSDLQLFGSPVVRRALREYLSALIEMAAALGAHALVFGSPKNRVRGKMPLGEATAIAIEFFREIGALAASRGCVVCIEPNPPSYGCDFVTTTPEAVALCTAIASRGIKVQGDTGAMIVMGEDTASAVAHAGPWLGHFHASEPELAELHHSSVHKAAARALADQKYGGWVSVEMRAAEGGSRPEAVDRAARRVVEFYG
jgi:D-psicose/D-tagatose/L-ribulose 3-epimerase